jgi:hypothetical protein
MLFCFQPDHVLDIITNSSSELFVMKGQTKDILTEMVSNIHPNYLDEYMPIKSTSELTENELNTYLWHMFYDQMPSLDFDEFFNEESIVNMEKERENWIPSPLPGFTLEEIFTEESLKKSEDSNYLNNFVYRMRFKKDFIKNNIEKIKAAIDLDGEKFFMFSLEDNPQWDYQEKFEEFATRYHLG